MQNRIRTEVVIKASKERVWHCLTAFEAYPSWNPFMISVEGNTTKGSRLKNTMLNNGKKFIFKPVVIDSVINKRFAWLGSLFVKGLFDGMHYFEIEDLGNNTVNLVHGENFSGLLAGYLFKKIGEDTRNNFVLMNSALKKLAEQQP